MLLCATGLESRRYLLGMADDVKPSPRILVLQLGHYHRAFRLQTDPIHFPFAYYLRVRVISRRPQEVGDDLELAIFGLAQRPILPDSRKVVIRSRTRRESQPAPVRACSRNRANQPSRL
jgi:hypothetical protein